MTVNERVRLVRNALNLTQKDWKQSNSGTNLFVPDRKGKQKCN